MKNKKKFVGYYAFGGENFLGNMSEQEKKYQQGGETDVNSRYKNIEYIQQGVNSNKLGKGVYLYTSDGKREFVTDMEFKNTVQRSTPYKKYISSAGNVGKHVPGTEGKSYTPVGIETSPENKISSNLKDITGIQPGVTHPTMGSGMYLQYKSPSTPGYNFKTDRDFITQEAWQRDVQNSPNVQEYRRKQALLQTPSQTPLKNNNFVAQYQGGGWKSGIGYSGSPEDDFMLEEEQSLPMELTPVSVQNPEYATRKYTIRKGDTLSGLIKGTSLTVRDLVNRNPHLANRTNRIIEGEEIEVPIYLEIPEGKRKQSTENKVAQSGKYTIKKGETLVEISKKTGVPMEKLIENNNISNPNKIQIGQTINLGAQISIPTKSPDKFDRAKWNSLAKHYQNKKYVSGPVPQLQGLTREQIDNITNRLNVTDPFSRIPKLQQGGQITMPDELRQSLNNVLKNMI